VAMPPIIIKETMHVAKTVFLVPFITTPRCAQIDNAIN
jgi:hypothetical protein